MATLTEVLNQFPLLDNTGFFATEVERDRYYKRMNLAPEYAFDSRRLLAGSAEAFELAVAWITEHLEMQTKFTRTYSSYGLKHICEDSIGYITNGLFIAAMIACGYRIRPMQESVSNVVFNVTRRSVRVTQGKRITARGGISPQMQQRGANTALGLCDLSRKHRDSNKAKGGE
jgi:hypothetical protein